MYLCIYAPVRQQPIFDHNRFDHLSSSRDGHKRTGVSRIVARDSGSQISQRSSTEAESMGVAIP